MSPIHDVKNQTIYVFSSAARPLYQQDVINNLSAPEGYIAHYRYRRLLVPDEIWEGGSGLLRALRRAQGVVVFVDQEKRGNEWVVIHLYPFRMATVQDMEIDGFTLHVYFALGAYIGYDGVSPKTYYDEILDCLPPEKRPPKAYVALGPRPDFLPTSPAQLVDDAGRAWESVIDVLGRQKPFENCIFYRVGGVWQVLSEWETRLYRLAGFRGRRMIPLSTVVSRRCGYELNSGSAYSLDLSFYHPKEPTEKMRKATLVPKMDTDYFEVVFRPIPLTFRYDKIEIDLLAKPVTQDVMTEIHMELDEKLAEGEEPCMASNLSLLVQIVYPRMTTIAALLIFGLGMAAATMSGSVADLLGTEYTWVDPTLAILGSLFSTITLFAYFGRFK